jgi:hypothetical protein
MTAVIGTGSRAALACGKLFLEIPFTSTFLV